MSKFTNGKYTFLNDEELYFSYYLDELKQSGIVIDYQYEEETFELAPDQKFTYTKTTQLKTKVKTENITKSFLKPITYTPDFAITFSKNMGLFCDTTMTKGMPMFNIGMDIDGNPTKSYVDIKGLFAGKTNSTQYTFPIKQKWMYDKFMIKVDKIVPFRLFEQTFTPKKVIELEVYRRDDQKRGINRGDTKLKYKIKTIEEWKKEVQYG